MTPGALTSVAMDGRITQEKIIKHKSLTSSKTLLSVPQQAETEVIEVKWDVNVKAGREGNV